MVCLLREKNQLEQVQICSKLEIILTFSRKCLFYRIFTLPNFTLTVKYILGSNNQMEEGFHLQQINVFQPGAISFQKCIKHLKTK